MSASARLPRRFARYELTAQIGRGGAGDVYRARVLGAERRVVALKLLRPDATSHDPRALERFVREGRLGAMVRHPNVVRVVEIGRSEGVPFVAMEYVDGASLRALLADGPLPGRALLEAAQQAALGLAALHDLGQTQDEQICLVHRDIKPGNLLVDRRGRLKIADFGIALLAGRDQVTSVIGTPGYMAPEQLFGRAVDARVDLFALGASLYYLAVGEHLLPRGSLGLTMEAIRKIDERLAEPTTWDPIEAVLSGLGPILARCMHFDAADRYADAHALWSDLEALRGAHGPALAETGGLAERVHRRRGRSAPVLRSTGSSLRANDAPFIGRSEEIGLLRGVARGAHAVIGPPGIGKTRLVQEAFPEAVWVDAADRGDAPALARALARAFGFQGAVDLELVLPQTRADVIAIDGLEAPGPDIAAAVARWAAANPRTRWIITSRSPVGELPEICPRPLDDARSLALLSAWAPDMEAQALEQVAVRLEGLPLALELAGRALAQGEERRTPRAFAAGAQGLRAALEWSWSNTPPAERHALAQLTIFQAPFRLSDAEAVVEPTSEPRAIGEVLAALIARGLVHRAGARFRMSPALQATAVESRGELLAPRDTHQLRLRHAVWFSAMGRPEALHAIRGPDARAALDRLAAARADLWAALAWSLGQPGGTTSAHCCIALCVLARAGRARPPDDATFERVLRQRHVQPQARVRLRLARALAEREDRQSLALAQAELALSESLALGDRRLIAEARICLADALVSQRRFAEAKPHLAAAWPLTQELQDRRLEVLALRAAARRYSRMGQPASALKIVRRAAARCRSIGDPAMSGTTLELEGLLLARNGQRRAAIPVLQEAARVLDALGDLKQAGRAWYNLDYAAAPLDRPLAAEARERAIKLLLAGGFTQLALEARLHQAVARAESGETEAAARIHQELSEASRARGYHRLHAAVLCDRLCLACALEDWEFIAQHLPDVAREVSQYGEPLRQFVVTYIAIRLFVVRGDLDHAERQLDQLSRHTKTRDAPYPSALLQQLRGICAEARADHALALGHMESALRVLSENDPSTAVETHGRRAVLLYALERPEEARLAIAAGRRLARTRGIDRSPSAQWLDRAAALDPG